MMPMMRLKKITGEIDGRLMATTETLQQEESAIVKFAAGDLNPTST